MGLDGVRRLVVATAHPGTLPDKATWYLVTNLPRPGGPREQDSPWPAAPLAEIVRLYGIRNWIEQGCKQVKDELGWADFQVRSGLAIRRHQALVNCAFSFCWAARPGPSRPLSATPPTAGDGERGPPAVPAPALTWLRALRAVRAWPPRGPCCSAGGPHGLRRPAPQLQALSDSVTTGRGLNFYLPP